VEQTELPGKTEESELPEETEQAELPGQPERPLEIEPQPEQSPEIEPLREPEIEPLREPEQPSEIEPLREPEQNPAERLLQSRQRFRPFRDDEFTKCVQIKLCDILPLQQENWKVGRSNFLQHGYYLYRHLLLGRTKDGSYILGVPGTRNQQEEYMAQVFGYEHFKMAASSGCGRRFGYWYRIVEAPERSAEAGIQLMQDYHKMKEKDAMA
ncbi:MAG: hypothetical protein LUI13_05230, partial [Lachnospiraceae bacterium]|nr:hypothetical protein [Lachnospiraceae bacterium]